MHTLPRGALAAAAAFLIAAGAAHATQPGTTVIVDQPSGFADPLRGAGNESQTRPAGAISASGRYVVFSSSADGLSAADDNRHANVYRKDRLTGEVVLVSVANDGKPANDNSYGAQISDDGNRVAFISYASNFDPRTEPGEHYAFVRDIAAGTTTLVSRAQGQLGAPGTAENVAISGDGRTVAFAANGQLQLEDKNGTMDVYARRGDDTILVSRADGADGKQTSSYSYEPALSYDGLYVAFTTAGKLSDADTNGLEDVYRRNIGTRRTALISARDGDGKAGDGASSQPAMTAGGESVAFTSKASDLDAQQPSDSGGRTDVFVRVGGDQRIMSHDVPLAGVKGSQFPDVSGDYPGPVHVAFTSYLEEDVAQVVVRDATSSTVRVASRAGVNGPLGDSVSTVPSISESGSVVAFTTAAGNLGGGIGGDAMDVAVRDLAAGTTTVASAPRSGPLVDDLDFVELHSGQGQLTPDSRFAVFEAGHDGLGPADRGGHVFRRDVRSGTTIRVDRGNGPHRPTPAQGHAPSQRRDRAQPRGLLGPRARPQARPGPLPADARRPRRARPALHARAARLPHRPPLTSPQRTRTGGTMTPTTLHAGPSPAELKRTHRATSAAGDYAAVAGHIDVAPPRDLLARMDIAPRMDVLDVATGTGNAALPAAAAGARVVGLDLTPELLEAAREREAGHGVRVEWREGDAEALPFADASFDRVLSIFGVQFAPRHALAAYQLARVTRPGGRIGLVNWTPASQIGDLFRVLGGYLPKPPAYASAPPLWGSQDHVRELFAGTDVELEFAHGHNPWRFESPEHWVAFMETSYGPLVKARAKLTAEDRWSDTRAEILAMVERRNAAADGSLLMLAEYLIVTGVKRG